MPAEEGHSETLSPVTPMPWGGQLHYGSEALATVDDENGGIVSDSEVNFAPTRSETTTQTLGFPYENYKNNIGKPMKTIGTHMKTM